MPRMRKSASLLHEVAPHGHLTNFSETSKRTNLHQRARIKDEARETRKKRKRDAKSNPQWKSSTPCILYSTWAGVEPRTSI